MSSMTLIAAQRVVERTVENRKRWGNLSTTGEYTKAQLLDALTVFYTHVEDLKQQMNKMSKQLNAAKAREAKRKKLTEKITKETK